MFTFFSRKKSRKIEQEELKKRSTHLFQPNMSLSKSKHAFNNAVARRHYGWQ